MLEMLKKTGSIRSQRQRSKKHVSFGNCYQESRDESVLLPSHSLSSSDSLCSHHTTIHPVDNFKRSLSHEEHAAYWYSDGELQTINQQLEEEIFQKMLQQREQYRSRNAFHVIDTLSMQYFNHHATDSAFRTNSLKHMTKLDRITQENTLRNGRRTRRHHFLSHSAPPSRGQRHTVSLQYYLNCCKGGATIYTQERGALRTNAMR